jgi:hypothetical protein
LRIIHLLSLVFGSYAFAGGSLDLEMSSSLHSNAVRVKSIWSDKKVLSNREIVRRLKSQGIDKIPLIVHESDREQALELKNQLAQKGIEAQVTPVPDDIESQVKNLKSPFSKTPAYKSFRQRFSGYLEKPSKSEISIGVGMGLVRGVMGAVVWLSLGVSPPVAALLTTLQTGALVVQTIYLKTFDNAFASRTLKDGKESRVKPLIEFNRRQLYDLAWLEAVRILSGPVGKAHSAFSLDGQMELLMNQTVMGTVGSIFGQKRSQMLSRQATNWMNFNNFAVTSSFWLLDLAGYHFFTVAKIGFLTVNFSTVLILASGASMIGWMIYGKNSVERFAGWEQGKAEVVVKAFQRVWDKIKKVGASSRVDGVGSQPFGKVCGLLLSAG